MRKVMIAAFVLPFLIVAAVSRAQTAPVPTQDVHVTAPASGFDGTGAAIDYTTYAYPVDNYQKNPDGLRIFMLECNKGTCYGPQGETIGTEREIAAALPHLTPKVASLPGYQCNQVCYDASKHVVGAAPSRKP